MQSRRDFITGIGAGAATVVGADLVYRRYSTPPLPPFAKICYAEVAEDLVAWDALQYRLKVANPTYIDIGAFHPIYHNNTYLFFKQGCRGVLVEPNVDMIEMLKTERPGDTVLNIGIGVTAEKEADYYCMNNPQLNTFSREEAEHCVKTSNEVRIEKVIKMQLVPVNEVLAQHFPGKLNFLSIDVEGLDLAILKTLDFGKYRPEVICAETLVFGENKLISEIGKFLASKDYVPCGGSFVNTLFVDKKLLVA